MYVFPKGLILWPEKVSMSGDLTSNFDRCVVFAYCLNLLSLNTLQLAPVSINAETCTPPIVKLTEN